MVTKGCLKDFLEERKTFEAGFFSPEHGYGAVVIGCLTTIDLLRLTCLLRPFVVLCVCVRFVKRAYDL